MKTIIISTLILIFLAPTQKNDTIYLLFDGKDKLCKKEKENYFFYNDSLISAKENYLKQGKLLPQGFCEYYHFTKTIENADTISNEEFNNLSILNRTDLVKKNVNLYQKKVFIVEKASNCNYIISRVNFEPCE